MLEIEVIMNKKCVDKIKDYSRILVDCFLDCSIKKELLSPLINRSFNSETKPEEISALKELQIILFLDFVKSLSNLILDEHEDSVSYYNIYKYLSNDFIKDSIKSDWIKSVQEPDVIFSVGFPEDEKESVVQSMVEKHKERVADSFELSYKNVIVDGHNILNNPKLNTLKSIRDKKVAHYEVNRNTIERRTLTLEEFNIHWIDPLLLFDEVKPLIFDIVLLTTNTSYNIDAEYHRQKAITDSLWSNFLN
jgi:hypothetical protein